MDNGKRRKREGSGLALADDLLTRALQFSTDSLRAWSFMQQVSQQFRRCALKPRSLSHFELVLSGPQLLDRLGPAAAGVRMLRLARVTDAGVQALSPLVALQTLRTSSCYEITDAGVQALSPLVALQTLDLS